MISNGTRILVLCTGNSCRSQMAEGFFRRRLEEAGFREATVRSAGLEPHGLNPRAVIVMKEAGIDISGQRSTSLEEYLSDEFDFVITVCDNAAEHCPVFPGKGERLHWPFEDPAGATGSESEILDKFREVRDLIDARIKNWVAVN